MNLGELRERIRLRMGISQNDPFIGVSELNAAINDALAELSEERDWPWLATSTTQTATTGVIAVPSDWTETISLRVGTQVPMSSLSLQQIEYQFPDDTATGTPYCYTLFGDTILVRPVPSASTQIEHRYRRAEPRLVDDEDEPLLPDALSLGVVEKASWLLWRRQGDGEKTAEAARAYEAWKIRAGDKMLRQRGSFTVRVRPGGAL